MADIKFSEFPKATISKDSDEIAILQDGVNKMIASPVLESKIINKTVSRVIEQGGASLNVINLKGVVPTYADLATITPTPIVNDAYQVETDGLVYVYTENGFQAEGDGFVVQPEPTGVVEDGNTQAVSGGEVFKSSLKEYAPNASIGLNTVVRNGLIYQLPVGTEFNGTESQAPGRVGSVFEKIYEPKVFKNIDANFAMYYTGDGISETDNPEVNRDNYFKLDDAIKSISLIGNYKYLSFERFNFKINADDTISINSIICLSNDLNISNDNPIVKKISCVISFLPTNLNEVKLYYNNYSNKYLEQIEIVLDATKFTENVQYSYTTTDLKSGLINPSVIKVERSKFNNYALDAYQEYKGSNFALNRSLSIKVVGEQRDFYLTRFERTSTTFYLGGYFVKNGESNISVRFELPVSEFTGKITGSPVAIGGTNFRNINFGLFFEIDADYLNQHFNNYAFKIEMNATPSIPTLTKSYVKEIVLATNLDFVSPGYADYRGMWYATTTYRRMSVGCKIPKGATRVKAIGGFNSRANILFGDVNGQLLGFALTDSDGITKYSGDETFESIDVEVPENAYYMHMSTLLTHQPTAKLIVQGNFELEDNNDYSTIQDVILDKTKPDGVYYAGKYCFRKNGSDINSLEVIDGNDLAKESDYQTKGFYQGSKKGILAYYKNNKYYFYNGSAKEIYYELNGVVTTITSAELHPTIWANSLAQSERLVIEVLDDDSVLFAMKETHSDGNITYSLFKVIEGSEPVRKFMYSNNFFTKEDDIKQSANGCPLGEWSFASAKGLIFATEYGQGTSKWWSDQGLSGGNGKGVSSRVWVSNDNGDTWYNALNLNEKKNDSEEESDDNWKYFSNTGAKNACHIHCIKYDNYDDRIYITNGDGENYLWSIDIKSLKTWLDTATAVNPTDLPVYTQPTGLMWNSVRLCTRENQPNINYHNMKFQLTALYPIEQGLLMGHDAPREFMYVAHRKGILSQSTLRFEPTYNWEFRSDFNTDSEFKASQDATDGFVMSMTKSRENDAVLTFHSASGKYCRIWATYNGVNNRIVFESENKEITFGCRPFFNENGDIILSTGSSTTNGNAGYYFLQKKH